MILWKLDRFSKKDEIVFVKQALRYREVYKGLCVVDVFRLKTRQFDNWIKIIVYFYLLFEV